MKSSKNSSKSKAAPKKAAAKAPARKPSTSAKAAPEAKTAARKAAAPPARKATPAPRRAPSAARSEPTPPPPPRPAPRAPESRAVRAARRKEMERFRTVLLARQRELTHAYAASKGDTRGHLDDGTEDYIDYAVNSYAKEFLLSLSEMDRRQLLQVEEALRRIDRGDFGRCLQCGEEINPKRLEVAPWARHCVRCQELEEQGLLPQYPYPAEGEGYEEEGEEEEGEEEFEAEEDEEEEEEVVEAPADEEALPEVVPVDLGEEEEE